MATKRVQLCNAPPPPPPKKKKKKKKYIYINNNILIPQKYSLFFSENPKYIEIQNFEPQNMVRAYVTNLTQASTTYFNEKVVLH